MLFDLFSVVEPSVSFGDDAEGEEEQIARKGTERQRHEEWTGKTGEDCMGKTWEIFRAIPTSAGRG